MVEVYGIPNCDTVKKTVSWLKENNIEFTFHDFKKEGISKEKLKQWLAVLSSDKLTNKKSKAWKNFSPAQQLTANTQKGVIELMHINTNFIKRPVIEIAGTILCGFNEQSYNAALSKN